MLFPICFMKFHEEMQKNLFWDKGLGDVTCIFNCYMFFLFFDYYRGLSPAEAELSYLNTARTLELYGVELHYARVSFNKWV